MHRIHRTRGNGKLVVAWERSINQQGMNQTRIVNLQNIHKNIQHICNISSGGGGPVRPRDAGVIFLLIAHWLRPVECYTEPRFNAMYSNTKSIAHHFHQMFVAV